MTSILFVGGVHGAGKTTISSLLAERLRACHVTAGQVIRETAGANYSVTTAPGNKSVSNVDANQELLLQGLDLCKARVGRGTIILDGHFSLLTSDESVSVIPLSVFRAIAPVGVLLVESESAEIHARLLSRDPDHAPSLSVLATLSVRERLHAQTVCADLEIPMEVVRGDGVSADSAKAVIPRLQRLLQGRT